MINLRKQKNISDEKTQFFINTAHDIRTPLTLIKAPLEELLEEETLTDNGITRTNIALRNVEVLLRLVSNLINFERTDVYSSKMSVSEYELNTYMNEIYNSFSSYAAIRRIEYTYESTFSYMNVSPVFKNCEVDAGEPIAYFCIMRIISSVSANVYLL